MNVKVFTAGLLDELVGLAKQSPRKRQHRNIHECHEEPVQRLLNALEYDTYIRPHRHSLDPKVESLFALRGQFALVTFDGAGHPQDVVLFGAGTAAPAAGVELASETWHTVIALSETAVLLEMKAGPFDPGAAKEFAAWSPEEGCEQATGYLASLRRLVAEWPTHLPDGAAPA